MKQGEGSGCLRPEGHLSVGRALDQELDIEFAEPAPPSQEARLSRRLPEASVPSPAERGRAAGGGLERVSADTEGVAGSPGTLSVQGCVSLWGQLRQGEAPPPAQGEGRDWGDGRKGVPVGRGVQASFIRTDLPFARL